MIPELAARALRVLEQTDLLTVISQSQSILSDLRIHADYSDQHPICQLLAHKIRNIAVENPDHSFPRAERMVCNLLGVTYDITEVSEEPFGDSTDAVVTGRNRDPLCDPAEYQRVVLAGKRLRV